MVGGWMVDGWFVDGWFKVDEGGWLMLMLALVSLAMPCLMIVYGYFV